MGFVENSSNQVSWQKTFSTFYIIIIIIIIIVVVIIIIINANIINIIVIIANRNQVQQIVGSFSYNITTVYLYRNSDSYK